MLPGATRDVKHISGGDGTVKKSAYNFKLASHEGAGLETVSLRLQYEVQITLVTHRLNTEVYWNKRPDERGTQPPTQMHKNMTFTVWCLACVKKRNTQCLSSEQ